MKKISIICSLIICLTFIFSCNLTAFAADNYEIKEVSSGSSITYKVNKLDSSKRYMIYFIPSGTFSGYIMKA